MKSEKHTAQHVAQRATYTGLFFSLLGLSWQPQSSVRQPGIQVGSDRPRLGIRPVGWRTVHGAVGAGPPDQQGLIHLLNHVAGLVMPASCSPVGDDGPRKGAHGGVVIHLPD